MKRVNEVFSDYLAGKNISKAYVANAILRKKTKVLELELTSDRYIEISEIEGLNNFIKQRFLLNDSMITIEYGENVVRKPLEEEIKDVIVLYAQKHPLLQAAINNCKLEIAEKEINFKFKIVVSFILKQLKYDKEIQSIIKSSYGRFYHINFMDDVTAEELIMYDKDKSRKEMLIIQKQLQEVAAARGKTLEMTPDEPKQENKVEEEKHEKGSKKKNNPFLILGRSSNINEQIIKITDITPDEGRVAISGEISNIETRELRSGKVLISFDLYDGSSSMTCKSFVKGEEFEEVFSKLKKARGVKLLGNAGYSKFSNEVEVIANVIVETKCKI